MMNWPGAVLRLLLPALIFVSLPAPIALGAGSVLINEVAWMGTASNPADEWVELYNSSVSAVDLTGWGLYEAGGGTLIINLSGSIAAGGYYLIERSDDNSISDITADVSSPFSGSGLHNSGEYLVLKNSAGEVEDAVDASAGWPKGDNASKASMERKSDGTWQTNDGVTINGKDAQGGNIVGTPRAANSSAGSGETTASPIPSSTSGGGSSSVPLLPVLKAEAGNDVVIEAGQPIALNGSTSQGAITYKWYLGDGAVKDGVEITHTYQFPGAYWVTLEVANSTDTHTDQLRVFVFGGKVLINEIFIDVSGSSAASDAVGGWIEIYNPQPTSADISAWILESATKKFVVPSFVLIPAKSFLVLTEAVTGFKLDSPGKVSLKYPTGPAVDEVVLEKIEAGYSASRTANGFFWTKEITPGRTNVVTASGGLLLEPVSVVPSRVSLKPASPPAQNYLASFYSEVAALPQPEENSLSDSVGISAQIGFWQKLLGELLFWVALAALVSLFIGFFYIKLHKK